MKNLLANDKFKTSITTDWGLYVNCGNDDITD